MFKIKRGLGCRASRAGARVALYDAASHQGENSAAWVAAGMIAPMMEGIDAGAEVAAQSLRERHGASPKTHALFRPCQSVAKGCANPCLMDVGCEVLMPWAAPIGTGQGPRNARALRELRERAPNIPLIVDAGIGLPSHACQVMEWGFDGVLLNTAVSRADDPVRMAGAFASAIKAGHGAFVAGPLCIFARRIR